MATPCPHPSKPLFEFDLTVNARERNYALLMHHFEGDLHKALHAQRESPFNCGSEFKPILTFEPIFKDHPSLPKMKKSSPMVQTGLFCHSTTPNK
jgi:hypothetical protein